MAVLTHRLRRSVCFNCFDGIIIKLTNHRCASGAESCDVTELRTRTITRCAVEARAGSHQTAIETGKVKIRTLTRAIQEKIGERLVFDNERIIHVSFSDTTCVVGLLPPVDDDPVQISAPI